MAALELFEEIMLPHLDAAHNLARWLTRNEQDAQDIVQEGYLRAFRFFGGNRGGDGKGGPLGNGRHAGRAGEGMAARDRAHYVAHMAAAAGPGRGGRGVR